MSMSGTIMWVSALKLSTVVTGSRSDYATDSDQCVTRPLHASDHANSESYLIRAFRQTQIPSDGHGLLL
jgi:hypothetical protein